MALKGGYRILDFGKYGAFTSGTEKDNCTGIYDAIESTNKMTVVSGLAISTTEYDDFPVLFIVSGTSFIGYVPTTGSGSITITVASDDGVTVTLVAPTEENAKKK